MTAEEIIRRICGRVHRDVNELNPIVDARLYDGSRLNVVYKNIALNGHAVTIRKFPQKAIGVSELINYGTIDRSTADFLKTMVLSGHNIFISGGTSSGKTTGKEPLQFDRFLFYPTICTVLEN